jgi:mono/diheme cytochrome c family protein
MNPMAAYSWRAAPAFIVCFLAAGFAPCYAQEVEFNRDIRPIFSDRCYACHGPDQANRKTKLRFDTEAGAKQDLGGAHFAVVPGDPVNSTILQKLRANNPAVRMPLGGPPLNENEIGLIHRWIEQGAKWEKHWSLIPPKRPAFPSVDDKAWPKNGIDWFVLNHLEREGLNPSAEAGKEALIRRVSLDLTGLPPTPAEVDAFLADRSPNAYEKVVDRLLASPRYGERMAAPWLAAARYADTNGYQTDAERYMWRWRDWVIEAFNRNMPFNEFTIEQIAGDMLPGATLDQEIASGFNRNHRGNGEGGIIPEEYAVEYVVDRVETTSAVWLGLTVGCARCHNHKYDPITQKEFYQLFAYFNNIPEKGNANKYGNSAPMIKAPTREQQAQLVEIENKLSAAEKTFVDLATDTERAQRSWENSLDRSKPISWSVERGIKAQFPLDSDADSHFDGKRAPEQGDKGNFGFLDKFSIAAWINPAAPTGSIVTRTIDIPEGHGWGLYLKDGKLQLNLVQRWLDDALRLETEDSLPLNQLHHVLVTYDGSRVADGVHMYVDGKPQKLKILLDELNQDFASKDPLRIGGGGGPENRFNGVIRDVRIYDVALKPEEAAVVAVAPSITEIAVIPPARRTPAQRDKINWYFLENQAPDPISRAWRSLAELRKQKEDFDDSLPTVMVMQEMPTPRQTHLLIRGAYDRPGENVLPGVPAALPALPKGAPNNRLGFAKWLVDSANPLPARVVMNRFWEMYFGNGLVKTVEDFGSQGEWPSNPELLDWLATEFIRIGWDVKAMQKLIVTSATYRQSSKTTPDLLQRDPENRLLARGPRFRLPPEVIRDQALAISGLLVEKIGGPSVKPYQPAGLWKEINGQNYPQDHGEGLYRRSLYTFWKRTAPPPTMMTFDAAGREVCVVRENRTNTPLQALDLMNDVTYLETARVLAEHMMTEGGTTPAERIAFAFHRATARDLSAAESRTLLDSFQYYRDAYQTDSDAARKLVSHGEYPRNEKLNVSELAAYTTVASLILNLDELLTKQ